MKTYTIHTRIGTLFIITLALFSSNRVLPAQAEYLGKCYYRDKNGISIRYSGGYPRSKQITLYLHDADPKTFRVIQDTPTNSCTIAPLYGQDGIHVFFRNKIIECADPITFTPHDGGYSVDGSSIFYRGVKIPSASPTQFHTVKIPQTTSFYGVAKTGQFYRGELIQARVDSNTFQALGGRWIKDARHIYFRDQRLPIKGADPATFRVLKPSKKMRMNWQWAVDQANIYHITEKGVEILKGADPKTFHLINTNYSKDHSHVYYMGRLVSGADAKTFTVPHSINAHTGYDKYGKYHLGKSVPKK